MLRLRVAGAEVLPNRQWIPNMLFVFSMSILWHIPESLNKNEGAALSPLRTIIGVHFNDRS